MTATSQLTSVAGGTPRSVRTGTVFSQQEGSGIPKLYGLHRWR